MFVKTTCSIVCLTMLLSCNKQTPEPKHTETIQSGWRAVYRNDGNGKPIEGNKDSLIAGIRNGYDVRIGWGWERERGDSILRLEHVAKPLYLSIIQDKHVSAIIDPHPLLQSYIDIDKQAFGEGGHIWQCIMTTKGTFNAQVYDRSNGELLKDWPQNHKMTWFVEYPPNPENNNTPLYK